MNTNRGVEIFSNLAIALRPKQWVKNLLVSAAPFASGTIQANSGQVIIGILGFAFASSFGYITNDWLDRNSDRLHKVKKERPFASGKLGFNHFVLLLVICVIGFSLSCYFLPRAYSIVLAIYLFITVSYTTLIKQHPVIEMFWVASGFLIRAIAGSAIIAQPPTGWFVLSVFFGALLIVSAKRLAEILAKHSLQTRKVLVLYSVEFLRLVISVSMGATLMTYSLWVFEVHPSSLIAQISIIPFALSLFIFSYIAEKGDAESPEILLLKSPVFLITSLTTILCLIQIFYR